MSKQWIVTGYSSKMDGLLLVVEANDKAKALKAAVKILDVTLRSLTVDDVERFVLAPKTISIEEIKNDMEQGEPRWFWEAWVQEVKVGDNHAEAVCW